MTDGDREIILLGKVTGSCEDAQFTIHIAPDWYDSTVLRNGKKLTDVTRCVITLQVGRATVIELTKGGA